MNRILEYSPAPEEAVVSRILVMVHKAVDENFPDAQKANRQFTKTVFSHEDQESTAQNKIPLPPGEDLDESESESTFGSSEDTGEMPAAKEEDTQAHQSALNPMRNLDESEPASRILTKEERNLEGPDVLSRALLGLIIAGFLLLFWLIFQN